MKSMNIPDAPGVTGKAGTEKRERILAVAEEIFFRQGYRGTTLDMICSELGVTKPYVYYYFRSKQDIFEILSWKASEACLTAFHFPPSDVRPAHERLAEGLRRFITANLDNFRSGTFFYRDPSVFRPEFYDRIHDLADAFYADLCGLLDGAKAEGKVTYDDTKLTALGVGSIAGFMYTWYRPDGRLSAPQMTDKMTTMLFRLVGWKD